MKEYISTALVGIDELTDKINQLSEDEIIDDEAHHELINSLTKSKSAIQIIEMLQDKHSDDDLEKMIKSFK